MCTPRAWFISFFGYSTSLLHMSGSRHLTTVKTTANVKQGRTFTHLVLLTRWINCWCYAGLTNIPGMIKNPWSLVARATKPCTVALNIFGIITGFSSVTQKTCVSSHVPSRKRQISVKLEDHSRILHPLYGTLSCLSLAPRALEASPWPLKPLWTPVLD